MTINEMLKESFGESFIIHNRNKDTFNNVSFNKNRLVSSYAEMCSYKYIVKLNSINLKSYGSVMLSVGKAESFIDKVKQGAVSVWNFIKKIINAIVNIIKWIYNKIIISIKKVAKLWNNIVNYFKNKKKTSSEAADSTTSDTGIDIETDTNSNMNSHNINNQGNSSRVQVYGGTLIFSPEMIDLISIVSGARKTTNRNNRINEITRLNDLMEPIIRLSNDNREISNRGINTIRNTLNNYTEYRRSIGLLYIVDSKSSYDTIRNRLASANNSDRVFVDLEETISLAETHGQTINKAVSFFEAYYNVSQRSLLATDKRMVDALNVCINKGNGSQRLSERGTQTFNNIKNNLTVLKNNIHRESVLTTELLRFVYNAGRDIYAILIENGRDGSAYVATTNVFKPASNSKIKEWKAHSDN